MVNYITLAQTGTKKFYFDNFDPTEDWEDNDPNFPADMVDSNIESFAATFIDLRVQLCDENTCAETGSETITKVEIRAFSKAGNYTGTVTAYLRPVFSFGDGDNHSWIPPSSTDDAPAEWSEWFDITEDTNAPGTWVWSDVVGLDIDHYPDLPVGGDPYHLFTSKIEIRATYLNECSMIAPEAASIDHIQNITEMNLWNGERIVFGLSRGKWSLLLKGQDWETDACDKILCVKQLGLRGLPIVISGLNNINWDREWMIQSFGWKQVSRNPIHYEWILLLERT